MERELCPLCGHKLRKRTNSKNEIVLVCERYPFCKYGSEKKYKTICDKCGKIKCECEKPEESVEKKEEGDKGVINKIKKKIATFHSSQTFKFGSGK